MRKVRSVVSLPPPPPLKPRPSMAMEPPAALADAPVEPLDYTMVRLQQQEQLQLMQPQRSSSSPSPQLSACSSSSPPPACSDSPGPCDRDRQDEVLHRLRQAVLQRHPQPLHSRAAGDRRRHLGDILAAPPLASFVGVQSTLPVTKSQLDPELDAKAAYAAECIKSRLDGCGKRVHLFLGILLHFGMPPSASGELIFRPVIAFSDEHKNPSARPTAYFVVLDSRLLALVWSKFKGNSSNEYSTLTRAIRSTRQKYRGIFEAVKNPGKKLYKFGPIALEQFQQLFPASYATKTEAA